MFSNNSPNMFATTTNLVGSVNVEAAKDGAEASTGASYRIPCPTNTHQRSSHPQIPLFHEILGTWWKPLASYGRSIWQKANAMTGHWQRVGKPICHGRLE